MTRTRRKPSDIPIGHALSIQEVQNITGLKAHDVCVGKNWIRIMLENGVCFTIRNWKIKPIQRKPEAVK